MAYVLTVSPPTYANAHNNVGFSVYDNVRSNNQAAYPDFTYICDVYIESVLVARLRAVPDPIYFSGVFNVKKILQDYMYASEPPSVIDAIIGNYKVRLDYQLKFGSEYGSTLTSNEIIDSSRVVYNSYNKFSYANGGGGDLFSAVSGFKTDRPLSVPISETGLISLIPYYAGTSGTFTITYKGYTQAGDLIYTAPITSTSLSAGLARSFDFSYTAVSPTTDEAYSTITIGTQTYRRDIVCHPKHSVYTVGFMNRYGCFESFDFYMASTKNINIERKSIEVLPYAIGVSGAITYNSPHGTTNNFSNKVGRKLKVKSDWIKDEVYVWLEQLVVSPKLYIYNLYGDAAWVRVTLTNTDYEPKQFVKDGLTILELEFDYEGYSPQRL